MQRIKMAVQKMAAEMIQSAPSDEAPLLAWSLICGSAVAEKTEALDVHQGVLRVRVPDAAWRDELSRLAPKYLAGIHQISGQIVTKIAFVLPYES